MENIDIHVARNNKMTEEPLLRRQFTKVGQAKGSQIRLIDGPPSND